MKEKKFVSNKDESVRLFEHPFLEKFTRVHPSVPLIIYLPVIGYFLYKAASEPSLNLTTIVIIFLAGLFIWTLTEYLFHRYIFHYEPSSKAGKYVHFLIHGVHHDYPKDSRRLVLPPIVSAPLATLFYFIFLAIAGKNVVAPSFAGFMSGYLCYDMIHYATHHFAMKSKIGLLLKQYHIKHHYQEDTKGFGVSSPLWDIIFKTTYTPKQTKESNRDLAAS